MHNRWYDISCAILYIMYVYMVHEILQLLYLHQRYCVDYVRGEKCGEYDLFQGNIPVLSGKTKKNSDTRKCYCSIKN